MMKQILDRLGLEAVNAGTWSGDTALRNDSSPLIESINPATGEIIASVRSVLPVRTMSITLQIPAGVVI